MRRLLPFKTLSLIVLFLTIQPGFVFPQKPSQENYSYMVNRGERPPIDLNSLSPDAYHEGVLLIKFQNNLTDFLEKYPIGLGEDGIVRFGLESVDALNEQYIAKLAKQHFLHPSLNNEFTEKHKAWGFHLWFRLEFDNNTDIVSLVRDYSALDVIEIAEPEFNIMHVNGSSFNEFIDSDLTVETGTRSWTPNDPQFINQWHYHNTGQAGGTPGADIDMLQAWEIEKGHPDVIVAIIDDGIQFNHPDLAGNMWPGIGYNFVNNISTIYPGDHGTHVAGTVAAVSNNMIGVSGIAGGSGTGDGVRLMSCQVFRSNSSGGFHLAPIYAADNGAAISQNSWSYTTPGAYNQNVLDAIDYFNANGGGLVSNGGITIFAAGNSNSNANYYPGYYSGTLAVAATNNQDKKAYFGGPTSASNYGTWVDISAPGGETYQVAARGVLSTITGSSYAYYQGTSMACPHVSGAAALLLSFAHRSGHTLQNSEVWDLLVENTDDHYAQNPSYLGQLGSGRLNAFLALSELYDLLFDVAFPSELTATAVGQNQIELSWEKNQNNDDVMLVWSPNNTFGTPEDGTVYTPGQSLPGGGTVLYRGAGITFEHTGLEAGTIYYYKAFSVDPSNAYSSGIKASAATDCIEISILPHSENFNASTNLPVCWEIVDLQGSELVWQIGVITGHGTLNPNLNGNYAYLNSDAYGSDNSQNADLVTPTLDLSNYTDVNLSFSHYFRQYLSVSEAKLLYSINDGETWNQVQTWTASTANPASFNQIIPQVAGQSQVRLKWNYTGTWGYYWAVDDILITGTPIATYWLGSVDNNWNNPANWSDGIPNSSLEPIIQPVTNFPQIENNLTIENIHINAGAMLIISPQGQLSVNGNITGDGSVLIQSDATGTGSLLHSSPDVHAIVDRFVNGPENSWHQLSAPVQDQTINDENPGDFDEGSFFTWYEPAQTWVMFSSTATSFVWPTWLDANDNHHGFIPVRGYLASYPYASGSPQIKRFQGLLNEGTQTSILSHQAHPDDLYHGFNLVGNPYPSSIDWKAQEGWSRSALLQTNQDEIDGFSYWIWNPEWGQYGTYHSGQAGDLGTAETSRYIAPMQGFWVQAAENGALVMDNNVRVHSDQNWLKYYTEPGTLRLTVSNMENPYRDEVILEFGTVGGSFGSKKMFSMIAEAPSIYLPVNDEALSIRFINNSHTYESIPVGFKPGVSAQHVISAEGLDFFDLVFLEDLNTGILHPLKMQNFYTFQATTQDEPRRFLLHFKALGIEETNHLQPYAYYKEGKLIVSGIFQEPSILQVFDVGGRLIREFQQDSGQRVFHFNSSPGLYFLRVINNLEVSTIKVVIP